MGFLFCFIPPEAYRESDCLRQAYEAGGWMARVGIPSFIVVVIGVVMLVRHRSLLRAMLQGARAGVPVEHVAPGRRVVIGWGVAIVLAFVATGLAYVHMRSVIENCV
jgi:hypothetical protein